MVEFIETRNVAADLLLNINILGTTKYDWEMFVSIVNCFGSSTLYAQWSLVLKLTQTTNQTPAHGGQVRVKQKTHALAAVWPFVCLPLNTNMHLNKSL